MPYYLEYATAAGAGRFVVEGPTVTSVITKAKAAVEGMNCTSAALRYTPDLIPAFGAGCLHARYTPKEGWVLQEAANPSDWK